ncbi:uncharacterized protein EV420DRAFT_582515 [Desarmillaria tabescens]|uniref:Uncharacterized protein n=1 Tax=Armillaria tabescens TaxID=1929756 RepID=A0AA39MGL1_ARMTA|nr:uncharacterized protein EV420DRAFT_582515 [Desarmillaria tabescens]KAK0432979.1 hypothetical protein EV420DRAFT_582515 [Desarmillaria tabescens]
MLYSWYTRQMCARLCSPLALAYGSNGSLMLAARPSPTARASREGPSRRTNHFYTFPPLLEAGKGVDPRNFILKSITSVLKDVLCDETVRSRRSLNDRYRSTDLDPCHHHYSIVKDINNRSRREKGRLQHVTISCLRVRLVKRRWANVHRIRGNLLIQTWIQHNSQTN